ncbi:MAG: SH3 domain-containing protein [Chloroflexi bacterium]|nr:SH3 domain-containing protein [Chloroflexota bacterium]MCC6893705.1 SH3 domain-containing protein [Anaerolineae bacterium]
MKGTLAHLYRLFVTILVGLVAAGCQAAGRQDSVNLLLQPDSPTMVSFPLMAASQIYAFTADAQLPMQVSLVPITRNLAYTAELRDEGGGVMATVASSTIQDAVLTIDPGSQRYTIAIKSENMTLQGILSVQVARSGVVSPNIAAIKAIVPTAEVVPFQSVAIVNTPAPAEPCAAASSTGVSVNLRNGPGTEYGVVGTLVYGTVLSVYGKSNNGWYQVIQDGQLFWVSGSVTTITGDCAALIDATPPTLEPVDTNVRLVIADSGWGSVNENVDSNATNSNDLIVVSSPSVTTTTQHFQEYTLTLLCSGSGAEGLRWGAIEAPSLKCGGSVVLPMTTTYNEQMIAVTLPQSATYNAVQYTLMAARRG